MLAREYEKLFPVLEELNVAYVAFSPLGNGFLSGKYDANSTSYPNPRQSERRTAVGEPWGQRYLFV